MDKATNIEEKNFRSSYYEKVGFRSVDEKKALETILKENVIDIRKLNNHCLKFIPPDNTRQRIWIQLLHLQPPADSVEEYIKSKKQYIDIIKHSFHFIVPEKKTTLGKNIGHMNSRYTWEVIGNEFHLLYYPDLTEEDISFSSTFHLYLLYWLMGVGQLSQHSLGSQLYVKKNVFECMSQIPPMLENFFEEEYQLYYASTRVFKIIQNIHSSLAVLIHHSVILLEKEDRELYLFLSQSTSWEFIPLDDWILSLFLNICQTSALYPLIDKIFSGSTFVLVYMAISTLIKFKDKLMLCKEQCDFNELFKSKLNPKDSETVVMRAIELWQQNGTLLYPPMKCNRCTLMYNDKKCCLREEMPYMFEFDEDHEINTKHKFCTNFYSCLSCFIQRNDKVEESEEESEDEESKVDTEQDNKGEDESSESVAPDTVLDPEATVTDTLINEDPLSVNPVTEDSLLVDSVEEDPLPEVSPSPEVPEYKDIVQEDSSGVDTAPDDSLIETDNISASQD